MKQKVFKQVNESLRSSQGDTRDVLSLCIRRLPSFDTVLGIEHQGIHLASIIGQLHSGPHSKEIHTILPENKSGGYKTKYIDLPGRKILLVFGTREISESARTMQVLKEIKARGGILTGKLIFSDFFH